MKLGAICIALIFVSLSTAFGQRAIPDDNLAYPVLIDLTNCTAGTVEVKGSGFYLNSGPAVYLVTARHVLFKAIAEPNSEAQLLCGKATLVSYSKDPIEKEQNRVSIDLTLLNVAGKVKAHPSHDVAIVEIAKMDDGSNDQHLAATSHTAKPSRGVEILHSTKSGLLLAPIDFIKRFNEVLTANDVYVLGYPSSIGLQQAPQIDYSAPLLRKGIVAGLNHTNNTLVLDCLTFQGNSGGPVLEVTPLGLGNRIRVIGVISQYVPLSETWVNTTLSYYNMQIHNSGYSIAEPMDPVLELIGK